MSVSVKITVKNRDVGKTRAIKDALDPDNKDFPKGIEFQTEENVDSLTFIFKSDIEKILSLRNTVDDLLEHLEAAHATLENVKQTVPHGANKVSKRYKELSGE